MEASLVYPCNIMQVWQLVIVVHWVFVCTQKLLELELAEINMQCGGGGNSQVRLDMNLIVFVARSRTKRTGCMLVFLMAILCTVSEVEHCF